MTQRTPDRQKVEERWDDICSQLRDRWPQLTQNDLRMIDGDSRKLVALVHQKTGANLHEIESQIDEIRAASDGFISRVTRTPQQATESVSQAATQAYETTGRHISRSPVQSVAVAFATGLLVGVCLTGVMIGPSRRDKWGPGE